MTEQELQGAERVAVKYFKEIINEVWRLRELVYRVERKGPDDRCPFCHGADNASEWAGHRSGCDAFTPEGELK